jgi:hypothetical protein
MSVGLIKNVFSMSPYVSYHAAFYSQTMRKQVAQMFMMHVNCTTTADVPATTEEADEQIACMKDVPFSTLMELNNSPQPLPIVAITNYGTAAGNAFDTLYGTPGLAMFIEINFAVAPCLDDYVLDMPPLVAYASGRNNDVTVVMGHMSNEYSGLFSSAGVLAGPAALLNVPYQIGISNLPWTATAKQMYDAAASAPDLATVTAAAYSGFGDTSQWHTNVQSATDVFFAWGIKAATDAMMTGGMTTYQLLDFMGEPESFWPYIPSAYFGGHYEYALGALHAAEDNANMGGYKWGFSFISGGRAPVAYSPSEVAVNTAMSTHFKNIMMGSPPDASWPANSGGKMVYGTQFPSGSEFSPCVRFHASTEGCVTEPTDAYRASQIAYFEDPSITPSTPATCAAPFVAAIQAGTDVSGSFGLSLPQLSDGTPYSCSACTCPASRQLLFGAPTVPEMSACSCASSD